MKHLINIPLKKMTGYLQKSVCIILVIKYSPVEHKVLANTIRTATAAAGSAWLRVGVWVVLVTRVSSVVSLRDDRVIVVDAMVVSLVQPRFLLCRQVVDHTLRLRLSQKPLFLRLRGAT